MSRWLGKIQVFEVVIWCGVHTIRKHAKPCGESYRLNQQAVVQERFQSSWNESDNLGKRGNLRGSSLLLFDGCVVVLAIAGRAKNGKTQAQK